MARTTLKNYPFPLEICTPSNKWFCGPTGVFIQNRMSIGSQGRIQERSRDWGAYMASAEHEPIRGFWGCAPSGVQGQSPWAGDQGAKGAERFLVLSYV